MEGVPQLTPFLFVAVLALGPVAVESCAPAVELISGASEPGVSGIVERTVVASNPLPWGRSVSMVTRLWGTATVERWATSNRGDDCSDPRRSVGIASFERIGGPDPPRLVPEGGLISDLEAAALTARFGAPVISTPGAADRVLAWLLVFPSVIVGAIGLVVVMALLFVRRRRARERDYLF